MAITTLLVKIITMNGGNARDIQNYSLIQIRQITMTNGGIGKDTPEKIPTREKSGTMMSGAGIKGVHDESVSNYGFIVYRNIGV